MLDDQQAGQMLELLEKLKESHWDILNQLGQKRPLSARDTVGMWAAVALLIAMFGSWVFWIKGQADDISEVRQNVAILQTSIHNLRSETRADNKTLLSVRDKVNAIALQVCRQCELPPDPPTDSPARNRSSIKTRRAVVGK